MANYGTFQYWIDAAQAITDKVKAEGRPITDAEVSEADEFLDRAKKVRDAEKRRGVSTPEDRAKLRDEVERMNASFNVPDTGGFSETLFAAGWNPKSTPSVRVSTATALGGRKANVFPASTDWSRTEPVTVAMGQDTRFLYPNLLIQDAGDAGSVQDFKQTARTLVGTVKRALDAATDKANVDVTLAIVNEALSQFAVTINDVPNALFEIVDPLRSFLDQEMRFQVQKAIDAHVLAQIVAAGPTFGNTGTTMIDKVRNAISAMRDLGANPDLLLINPTDNAALDLLADAGGYVFSTRRAGDASPLFDLKIIEAAGAAPPYVIDSKMLGVLYLGPLDFAIDPFTGFRKNLSTVRAEVNALYHVRNIQGARRIAAA